MLIIRDTLAFVAIAAFVVLVCKISLFVEVLS